jgi:hypothetical protein
MRSRLISRELLSSLFIDEVVSADNFVEELDPAVFVDELDPIELLPESEVIAFSMSTRAGFVFLFVSTFSRTSDTTTIAIIIMAAPAEL